MFLEKRLLSELLELYRREEILDVFVEGVRDAEVYSAVCESLGKSLVFRHPHQVDLGDLPTEFFDGLDSRSNRDKIIALNRVVASVQHRSRVVCVVDKDFDDFIIPNKEHESLWSTDFCCLEAYYLTEPTIRRLFSIGLSGFPFDESIIVAEIGKIMRQRFALRLFVRLHSNSSSLRNIEDEFSVDRRTGMVTVDARECWRVFIQRNGLHAMENELREHYEHCLETVSSMDVRNVCHGHDLIGALFSYVKRVRNAYNYRSENFEKAFYLAVDSGNFRNYGLIQSLLGV